MVSEKDRLLTGIRQELRLRMMNVYSPQMALRVLNIPLRGPAPPSGIATTAQV